MTKPLCCTAEIGILLYINYTFIKINKKQDCLGGGTTIGLVWTN